MQQQQFNLIDVPASRSKDGGGSFDAEALVKGSGKRARDQRDVLLGFCFYPNSTTKQLAAMLTAGKAPEIRLAMRYTVARCAPELKSADLLERKKGSSKGSRQFEWSPTEKGRALAARVGKVQP